MKTRILAVALAVLWSGLAQAQTTTTVVAAQFKLSTGGCTIMSGTSGSGTPESVITGTTCDLWFDTATGELWKKLSGTATTTGWSRIPSTVIPNTWSTPLSTAGNANKFVAEDLPLSSFEIRGGRGIFLERHSSELTGDPGFYMRDETGVIFTLYFDDDASNLGVELGLGAQGIARMGGTGKLTFGIGQAYPLLFTSVGTTSSSPVTATWSPYTANQASGYVSQTTGWQISGAGSADFRYLFTDELHAKAFIADLEQALAGGQIIAKSVAMLGAAFTAPAAGATATLTVRDLPSAADMAAFEANDHVRIRTFSRAAGSLSITDCWGIVTGYTDNADGTQSWTFTRNSGADAGAMAATTVVAVDSIVLDYGTSGNGFYEVNAIDGAYAENSPYAQVVSWAGDSPIAANQTLRARLGNLKGVTGTAGEYGLLAGTYAATDGAYFRASNEAFELHGIDLSLWDSGTKTVFLDHAGPSFALGSPLPSAYGTGAGVWMGLDSGAYKFRVGDPSGGQVAWDGTTLKAAGWTLAATSLTDTAGAVGLSSAVTAGDDIRIWAGHATPGSAPFRVTEAGVLTATSGTVGGWSLGATAITDTAGTVGMSSAVTGGDDIRFWAGDVTPGSAEFRVTEAGALTATSATITGAITATSGTFTGTVNATAGYFGTASTDVAIDNDGITIGSTGRLNTSGASAYGTGTGIWMGYDSTAYKFRVGDPSGSRLQWDGSALGVYGTLYTDYIEISTTNGISFDAGGDYAARGVNWDDGSFIRSRTDISALVIEGGAGSQINFYSAYMKLWGGSATGDYCLYLTGDELSPGGDGLLDLGSLALPWNDLWIDGAVKAQAATATLGNSSYPFDEIYVNPESTTAADYPAVYSSANQKLYHKTDGTNGTVCGSGVNELTIEYGIVTGYSCASPSSGPEARIMALESELAALRAQVLAMMAERGRQ